MLESEAAKLVLEGACSLVVEAVNCYNERDHILWIVLQT